LVNKEGAPIIRYPLYGYDFNPGEAAKRIKFNQGRPEDIGLADRMPKSIKPQDTLPLPKEGENNVESRPAAAQVP
jgi:hypothetical protein